MTTEHNRLSVLVTGSSSGFGELIAKTVALAGHHVFASMRGLADRNRDAAATLAAWAAAQQVRLDLLELDVTRDESVAAAVEEAYEKAGHIDVVVNNAGASARGPLEAFSIEEMQDLFNLNAFGPLRVDKAVLPAMRARRSGLLVHVSSTLGRVLPGSGGLYPASKWALEGLVESLHYQIKPFGVEAVLVEPGSYPTPATGKAVIAGGTQITMEYADVTPPQPPSASRLLPPSANQEVADVIKHLIDLPAGTRPLRTVIGAVFTDGVAEYNDFYEATKTRLRESLRRPQPLESRT